MQSGLFRTKLFSLVQSRELTHSYVRQTSATESLNGIFSGFIGLAVLGVMVSGTFEAYLLIQSGIPMGKDALHVLWLITVQQVSSMVMLIQGAKLNHMV